MDQPLNISLLTYGSRGDVEPFLALADGLTAAGHRVTLAAPERYQTFLENDHVLYQGLPGDPGSLADDLRERAGKNPLKLVTAMTRHVMPIAVDVFREAQKASRGADIILHSFAMTDGGHTLARQERARDISVQFFPVFQPTSQFPSIVFPDLPLGDTYRRLTHHLNTLVFRWGGRFMYAFLRRKHRSLPRLAEWPFAKKAPEIVPTFFAFSEHVIPKPPDWPEQVLITGYWHRQRAEGWQPPERLTRFLKRHPQPVYISLGSMVPQPEKRLMELFIDVLEEVDSPGLISLGHPKEYAWAARENVFITGPMPHDWIFPRTKAVLHHGGAGTTGAVMRSGVPGVVLPVSADQFFWGKRAQALQVSPKPIPFRERSRENISDALKQVINDPSFNHQAQNLGRKLRKENGVEQAIKEMERLYWGRRAQG